MIQIGNKIWITDDLQESVEGNTPTPSTQVWFEGERLPGVQHIKMEWSADQYLANKWCSIFSLSSHYDATIELFAMEMAQHGFKVEVIYPQPGHEQVEYYHLKDGTIRREEKPCRTLSFGKSKEKETSGSSQ